MRKMCWTDYSFLSKQSVLSAHKIARFLPPYGYVIWFGTVNYKAGVPSDSSSEDEGGLEDEPGVSYLQRDRPSSRG